MPPTGAGEVGAAGDRKARDHTAHDESAFDHTAHDQAAHHVAARHPTVSELAPRDRAVRLKALAREEGFARVGVCPAGASAHLDMLREWIEAGRHGTMAYMARDDALERRGDPRLSVPGAKSILVVAHDYFQPDRPGIPDDPSQGVIARYARGRDYHRVVKGKLERVFRRFQEGGEEVVGRVYVDTGPLLERELGQRAGLGWFGRNTMLIHPRHGSYFFLGALLLDLDVEPDPPFAADHCGSCRACLDACPTGALLGRDDAGAPVIDATRCISYLTIENRGPIPTELRPLIGNRVYGCDICQEVCPFNVKFAEEASEPGYAARGPGERPTGVQALPGVDAMPREEAFQGKGVSGETRSGVSAETRTGVPPETRTDVPAETRRSEDPSHPGTNAPSLVGLLRMALDEESWESFSRGSAIRRAGRAGFARNVAVALGNWLASIDEPPEEALTVLQDALEDGDPLVRQHAAWALEVGAAQRPSPHRMPTMGRRRNRGSTPD